MTIPGLNLISDLLKPQAQPVAGRQHLMLAGIDQTAFLKQWGEPETTIGLNRLGVFNKLGPLFLVNDPAHEVHHSIWIYKKRDRILFFTKKRLVFHFKWSEFPPHSLSQEP